MGDLDNDGDIDVVVVFKTEAKALFYRNDGAMTFVEVGDLAVIADPYGGINLRKTLLVDIDGDGDLDLLTHARTPLAATLEAQKESYHEQYGATGF